NKFEILLMLPGLKKRLGRAIDKDGVDLPKTLSAIAWLMRRLGKAAKKQYRQSFEEFARAFEISSKVLAEQGGSEMKLELGITMSEILGMMPTILSEAWGHYSDDKKLTVDEGVALVAVILTQMGAAADDDEVKEFFTAQAGALNALVPLLGVDDEEPPVDPPTEDPPSDPA
ncbi:MAG: hypothetical protein MJA29_07200, partial [Candidatus Omnitrophica bacterium]|nr:hypothetical protein [Candidatus Omnitrophota bacterium]